MATLHTMTRKIELSDRTYQLLEQLRDGWHKANASKNDKDEEPMSIKDFIYLMVCSLKYKKTKLPGDD